MRSVLLFIESSNVLFNRILEYSNVLVLNLWKEILIMSKQLPLFTIHVSHVSGHGYFKHIKDW